MNDNLTIQRVRTRLSHQFMRRTSLKPLANGRNIVGCYIVRPSAHPATCCYIRLCFVGSCCSKFKTFEPTTSPNISFVPRSRKRSATWWIHLHSSPNWGHERALYIWFPKYYGLYPYPNGLHRQVCRELLYPFTHHCQHGRNNCQDCWPNNVGSCCLRLHVPLKLRQKGERNRATCCATLPSFTTHESSLCFCSKTD